MGNQKYQQIEPETILIINLFYKLRIIQFNYKKNQKKMIKQTDDEFLTKYCEFSRYNYQQLTDVQQKYLGKIQEPNILVSAPPGSGKSQVAKMKILYMVNRDPNGKFKCLYMAPTKMICQQKLGQFKKLAEFINEEYCIDLKVKYADSDSEQKEHIWAIFQDSNIVIATPQTYYSLLRFNRGCLKVVNLILIDEIHLLGQESRMLKFENILNSIIQHQKEMRKKKEQTFDLIGFSGTIKQLSEISNWMNAQCVKGEGRKRKLQVLCKVTGTRRNQTSLEQQQNRKQQNKNTTNSYLQHFLPKSIHLVMQKCFQQQKIKDNINFIIFCTQIDYCKKNAKYLDKLIKCRENDQQLKAQKVNKDFLKSTKKQLEACYQNKKIENIPPEIQHIIGHVTDQDLKQLLKQRIGFHHAQLSKNDKKIIEHLFKEKWIVYLFSTTTLADGTNINPRSVIVMDTYLGETQEGQEIHYKRSKILQMIGRAGRQSKQNGYYLILDKQQTIQKYYRQYTQNQKGEVHTMEIEDINSCFFDKIEEFIMFTIGFWGKAKDDLDNMVEFLMEKSKDNFYHKLNNDKAEQKQLKSKIEKTIKKFKQNQFHRVLQQYFQQSTLSFENYCFIYKQFKLKTKDELNFLRKILSIPEFKSVAKWRKKIDNLGEKNLRKEKFSDPFGLKFNNKQTYQQTKGIILTHAIFSGQIDKLYSIKEDHKEQGAKILLVFEAIIKVVLSILIKIPNYTEFMDPNTIFYLKIYNKYKQVAITKTKSLCREQNQISQCCQFNNKNAQDNKSWVQEICGRRSHWDLKHCLSQFLVNQQQHMQYQQYNNFFQIKNAIYNGSQSRLDGIDQIKNYIIEVSEDKNKYVLKCKQKFHLIKCWQEGGKGMMSGLEYQKYQNSYEFDKEDRKEYSLIFLFKKIIGVDHIATYCPFQDNAHLSIGINEEYRPATISKRTKKNGGQVQKEDMDCENTRSKKSIGQKQRKPKEDKKKQSKGEIKKKKNEKRKHGQISISQHMDSDDGKDIKTQRNKQTKSEKK